MSESSVSKKVKKNKNKKEESKLKPIDVFRISTDDPMITSLIKLCKECMGEFQLSQKDVNRTVEKVNNVGGGNLNWNQLG